MQLHCSVFFDLAIKELHISQDEIFVTLCKIAYKGYIVMEPFWEAFNPVANDLRIWRDLESDLSKTARDEYACNAIRFVKNLSAQQEV